MPSPQLRWIKRHPILAAAIAGAIVGVANVLLVEIAGLFHKNTKAVLLILPSSGLADPAHPLGVMQAAFVLLIDFAGNALGYALLFALPVALVVAILRISRRQGGGPSS